MIYSTDPICSWGDFRQSAPCSQDDPACDIKLVTECNAPFAECRVHGQVDIPKVTFAREIPYNHHAGRGFLYGPNWKRTLIV